MLSCQMRDGLAWATVLSPSFVSGRELLDALRGLERLTHFPRGTGLLLDGRSVSEEARGHATSDLSMAAFELVHLGIGRCAVVHAPARLDQALRFVSVAKAEALPMAVFLEPAPAVQWLLTGGINEPGR
jgi:hypothetical protein